MRSNSEHMEQLEKLNINTIDVVIVNLYPFKATVMKEGIELQEAIENIDIGGPTMLRSAAKNYQDVIVMVDPADYSKVLEEMKNGGVSLDTKFYLMYKVYSHTAVYDSMISNYMREKIGIRYPDQITFAYEKAQEMRYGENPHQNGMFYKECFPVSGSLPGAEQLHGKELSYNNVNDTNAALDILREHSEPTIVALKHTNPCGVGTASKIADAYRMAYEVDPVSIYGGIIAANREIDAETATEINKIFIEIVVAPSYTDEALEILKGKKNIRILKLATINAPIPATAYDMKKVLGGLLVQDYDTVLNDKLEIVTDKKPTDAELKDMLFAMKIVKHTKSNAIAIAKDGRLLGVGTGQTNRIWAAEQAIEHSGEAVKGAVMASDAFFPFPDCVEAAYKAEITAIVQPGGSVNDIKSIEACNKCGIAMVFTGIRHFKH
jgi:phosphoribosylaminoimidazolecarboxamide formyltransferase/IMP cyclohydrolase